jgi:uracil-DNA glycosylase
MGLRQGTQSQGENPGASDKSFVMHCERFFSEQIRAQRPAVIITLGLWVPRAIATLSPELHCWRGAKKMTIKELDASGPLKNGVTFHDVPNWKTVVVALVHPAHRPANVLKRRYCNSAGNEFSCNDAEIEMLQDAIELSQLRRDCI